MMSQSRLIWIVLCLLVLCSICASVSANLPPDVAITKSAGSAATGETINFDASSSSDPEGGTLTFLWTFFDTGAEKSGPVVTYTYSTPGTKYIGLTVTDDKGAKTTASAAITVKISDVFGTPQVTTTAQVFNVSPQETTPVTYEPTRAVTRGRTGTGADENNMDTSGGTGSGANQVPAPEPTQTPLTGSPIFMYLIIGAIGLLIVMLLVIVVLKRTR